MNETNISGLAILRTPANPIIFPYKIQNVLRDVGPTGVSGVLVPDSATPDGFGGGQFVVFY